MNEPQVALGKRIRNLRDGMGFTQDRLAEMAGISLKHLGELERGRGNPTLSSLKGLSDALDVSLVELFSYDHEQLSEEQIREQAVQAIKDAPGRECRTFYRVLRALTK